MRIAGNAGTGVIPFGQYQNAPVAELAWPAIITAMRGAATKKLRDFDGREERLASRLRRPGATTGSVQGGSTDGSGGATT